MLGGSSADRGRWIRARAWNSAFWDSSAHLPTYLRLANVQFDLNAAKFHKRCVVLMTRSPRK